MYSQFHCTLNVQCSTISLVTNNSPMNKFLSWLIPVMITIHQRNQKVFTDDDTVNDSTWVLPDKYITDWLTIPLILSLLTLFSLFLPSTNMSLSKKCNVLFSLVTNNSPMNRYSVLDFLICANPVLSISLFSAESGQVSYRKVPCFTNKVMEWYKHVFQIQNFPWWQDLSYSSANYIHCSAKLSATVHNSPLKLFFVHFSSEAELQILFLEDHHLSKIQLGTNVRFIKICS